MIRCTTFPWLDANYRTSEMRRKANSPMGHSTCHVGLWDLGWNHPKTPIWYCWWFRNPANQLRYGKYSHYLHCFIHPNGGCLGFLNHQQYDLICLLLFFLISPLHLTAHRWKHKHNCNLHSHWRLTRFESATNRQRFKRDITNIRLPCSLVKKTSSSSSSSPNRLKFPQKKHMCNLRSL